MGDVCIPICRGKGTALRQREQWDSPYLYNFEVLLYIILEKNDFENLNIPKFFALFRCSKCPNDAHLPLYSPTADQLYFTYTYLLPIYPIIPMADIRKWVNFTDSPIRKMSVIIIYFLQALIIVCKSEPLISSEQLR